VSTSATVDPGTAAAPESARKRWRRRISDGAPLFPLVILFGLNAVDQADQRIFALLAPNIRDNFHLDNSEFLLIVALGLVLGLLLSIPFGFAADRIPRLPIVIGGAVAFGVFSMFTGLATSVWMLVIARAGTSFGTAVSTPTHNSLLADYYDIPVRPKVYSVHRAALAVGACLGPLIAGILTSWFSWRVPFVLVIVPTTVFVILAFWLREPVRGHFERQAMGADDDTIATEVAAPSYAESWRVCWNVGTLRRIFYALPFLAVAFIGLEIFGSLFYQQVFHLNARERGYVFALVAPAQLIGLLLTTRIITRLFVRSATLVPRFVAAVGVAVAIAWTAFALSPNLVIAVILNAVVTGLVVLIVPPIFASLSLAIPPKIRSFGFAVAALWILPGLVLLPVVGALADEWGIRTGLILMVPVFLVGAMVVASAGKEIEKDIKRVWTAAAAQSEVLYERRQGRAKLLLVRGISVHYGAVQVLFDVNLEIDEGEIVALLGTNGAGKSTLLKAIAGLVDPTEGAIVFDGRDLSYTPADEAAGRGVTMVPGGQGVFPSLTVRENLQLAGWLHRQDKDHLRQATDRVMEIFPVLRERLDEASGNLSGGQQQMLTLGMAFIEQPRLLMIDELSLGLAPSVVSQLLEIVRELKAAGTTIILVEQSVNVALTVAETAYFMEKGEIRFHGPTAELLERPDVLRSVFLEGAGTHETAVAGVVTMPAVPVRPSSNGDGDGPELSTRLEVRDLTKRFGGITALDHVGFAVGAGEIVGFLGPNGAGKTTLFDVISGFTPQEIGSIELSDTQGVAHDVSRRSPQMRARLGLGRSFQDGRLFSALTVTETIAVALECSVEVRDPLAAALHLPAVVDSEAAVETRVEELIELMGLGAFRDKFVHELSTGSRRIVDLACILAHQPTVLLLDEPSSGIAQREAEALGPLLLGIRESLGASILVIEHDLPLLTSVSDRMIAMDLGAVIARGAPNDVVHDPAVVASYLGTDQAAISRSGGRGASST
jgi:ABC-type branched-subunit amino acid transport system ATPase component/MFS family permease